MKNTPLTMMLYQYDIADNVSLKFEKINLFNQYF